MTKQCGRCGEYYDIRLNVGRWRCRFHPMGFKEGTATWACCGVSLDRLLSPSSQRGCRRADHDVVAGDEYAFVRAYTGLPAITEAAVRSAHSRAGFIILLTDLGQPKYAEQVADAVRHDAFIDPAFYEQEANEDVARTALVELDIAQRELEINGGEPRPTDPMDPFSSPLTARFVDDGKYVAKILRFVRTIRNDSRRHGLLAKLAKGMASKYDTGFPLTLMVRRYAAATDPDIAASVPHASTYSYTARYLHVITSSS